RLLTRQFPEFDKRNILENYDEYVFQSNNSEYSDSNCNKVDSAEVDNVIQHKLSYMAGNAILKFIKKYRQVSTKALPRSTKDGLLFLDTLKKDYTKFLSIPVVQIKDR
ncbi:40599_t:CDS:2, partial [Gigaspora margarita]